MNEYALMIDVQNDFCQIGGSLYVDGAEYDIKNMVSFIKSKPNLKTLASLDTHQKKQIFFSSWWVDNNGKHPEPFTEITDEYIPLYEKQLSKRYQYVMKKKNKKIMIWPDHTLIGTEGHNIHEDILDVLNLENTEFIMKGMSPISERYGIFEDEAGIDIDHLLYDKIFHIIDKCDWFYIFGEAKSHCVLATIEQLSQYLRIEPRLYNKICILENCMSPIKGYEQETEDKFREFKNLGINIIK